MITTDAIVNAMAIKGLVLLVGGLTVFPGIVLWGWLRYGVSPRDLIRALMGR